MPGLYVHMDVARTALRQLSGNAGAAPVFGEPGPSASTLEQIAQDHPAYVALGALGPDIFFLLPDFKPPMGSGLWGAANTIKELYDWWDENFLEPWENTLGPIGMNTADTLGALTGGLLTQLGDIASRAIQFLIAFVEVQIVRQYDVFGILGSGVGDAYDEQTFFWSDMLHYRKTYEFGAHLFRAATDAQDPQLQAFALGWMTHLATDTTGHGFTNEKCGGPYRLHWQRHKLVENHMDGKVCDVERGSEPIYDMLSNSALHLWIAFNPDGTSRHDCFDAQPGPSYAIGDETPDILDRQSKWDIDSDLPQDLADFLAKAFRDFFVDGTMDVAGPQGHLASHPTIIEDIVAGSQGYADAEAIKTTYWWMYHFLKWTTTDYYKMRRPDAPDVVEVPPFPSPPGSGTPTPGPGGSDSPSALEILLAIFAWLLYIAQVIAWGATALISIITTLSTYPIRLLVYEYIELPLYNAWLALHWYLAHTGFALPMKSELNPGLMTLGLAPQDAWATVEAALDDLSGGIVTPTPSVTEPSGLGRARTLPREAVVDDRSVVQNLMGFLPELGCGSTSDVASEFLQPWKYPTANLAGDAILTEPYELLHSPYGALTDASVLLAPQPGDAQARQDFEGSQNEGETIEHEFKHLPQGQSLGGPVDFTAYVVARLTRDHADMPNFNLDSDRGYGFLCWDWRRTNDARAVPSAYRDPANPAGSPHQYLAPTSAGFGWCPDDVVVGTAPAGHDPRSPRPVEIRYIDRQDKV